MEGGEGSRRAERSLGARGDERDVHTEMHENKRETNRTWPTGERARCERESERKRTRTRECNVARCASYIEAQEGSRRIEEAE